MTNGERQHEYDWGGAHRPVIVVSGFMGTGKSSVGEVLSRMLGLRFIDTDTEIERQQACSINHIFADKGEPFFRHIEKSYCMSLEGIRGAVIATGGGSLLDPEVFEMFSSTGQVILLEASPEVLARRIQISNKRPLMNDDTGEQTAAALQRRIRALLETRGGVYGKIKLKYDTSNTTPLEAACRIAASIDVPSHTLEVNLTQGGDAAPAGSNEMIHRGRAGRAHIEVGRGAISKLGALLKRFEIDTEVFFVIPEKIRDIFGDQLGASLDNAGIPFKTVPLDDGDTAKNIGQAERIINKIIAGGARRDSTIIPVGGGVTGDLGGFVAAIYMRGVPLVHIPTTLLAQVDSSVGGKVGVNHKLAKNLIGGFYQPHAVLIDPCALQTLPIDEVSNGMAEVVKSAIIGSRKLFEYLEQQISRSRCELFHDVDFLEKCVLESVRIKAGIVNRDPYERSLRRILNLGHTVGHAIEASTGYSGIKHGQAVSLGTIVALRIASDRNQIDPDLVTRTAAILDWCGLPTSLANVDRTNLRKSLHLDKKIKNGTIHYVLPTGIGEAVVVDDVSEEEIFSTLEKGIQ